MICYPLSDLMLAGICEIRLISTPHDLLLFHTLRGDGLAFGIGISYAEQTSPDGLAQAFVMGEDFLDGSPAAMDRDDSIFHGDQLQAKCRAAAALTRSPRFLPAS